MHAPCYHGLRIMSLQIRVKKKKLFQLSLQYKQGTAGMPHLYKLSHTDRHHVFCNALCSSKSRADGPLYQSDSKAGLGVVGGLGGSKVAPDHRRIR